MVPKPDGSSRLILNLKELNEFIETEHFKLEDDKVASKLINQGCFMGKLNLEDAYYLVSVDKESRRFLRFSFGGTLYEFNCLPFGLNTAPFIFTKIMKPVVSHLRSLGYVSTIYLDDMLLFGNTNTDCLNNITTTVNLLKRLGFSINEKKSCKVPAQICSFLGFVFNSRTMTLELSREKRQKIKDQVNLFKGKHKCKIEEFARLVGCLVSCCPAIQYSWAHIKALEREKYLALLKSRGDYKATMVLRGTLQKDFSWWEHNILSRVSLISNRIYKMVIFSDASRSGWGVSCETNRAHGLWDETDKEYHLNYLELLAAFFGLKCFASQDALQHLASN